MHSISITPECYSGILVKNTPSFRKGLGVGYICRFLRFTFSFTPLIPCLLPPRDEREKTERTTAQLPALQKCCLLIFAIAIGCLVLADFTATKSPPFFVHYPEYYSWHPCVPATCCVFASDLAKFSPLFFRYRWLLCSRGSAREISSPLNLKL